jgi:L-lactate dehydrogenase complex protein LldE
MIALHSPCLVQARRPKLLRAMRVVGEALGWEQTVPRGQTCCGLPAWEAGFEDVARDAARRTVYLLRGADVILTPSAVCYPMLTEHIPALLAGEPQSGGADALARKTRLWSEYLAENGEALLLRLRFSGRVMLQDSCVRGFSEAFRAFIAAIPGLTLVESLGDCCTFSHDLSRRHPDIAGAIAESQAAVLSRRKLDVVLINEPGCLVQLQPYCRESRNTLLLHPAEFLARLLGL